MKIRNSSSRRAITPILATVILIAITLVAGIAIAGFVFNLFGIFSNPPQVNYVTSNVSHLFNNGTAALRNPSCTLTKPTAHTDWLQFTNSGTGTGTIKLVAFSSNAGALTPSSGLPLPSAGVCSLGPGVTLYVELAGVGTGPVFAGDTFFGSVTLTGGQVISFSGTFS